MNFLKYPSIENVYRTKTINKIKDQGFSDGEWVVLNKIHGANFAFYSNGTKIKPSKRTGWMKESDGNFGNYIRVLSKYREQLLDASEYLTGMYGHPNVTFMGELFGGFYPHPDVKKVPHSVRIQKGVFYCPHNDFYLFDIKVDNRYLPHDVVEYIGKTWILPYAKSLFKGTFDECINFNHDFEDKTYEYFGLPKIEGDNCSEGVVIKPVISKFFNSGKRIILKSKNEKFLEKTAKKKRQPKKIHEWSVNGAKLYTEISTYITESRLSNVLSHGHVIGQKDFRKLSGLLNKDVFKDFMIDNGDAFKCLDITEQKMIKKGLDKMSSDLVVYYQ